MLLRVKNLKEEKKEDKFSYSIFLTNFKKTQIEKVKIICFNLFSFIFKFLYCVLRLIIQLINENILIAIFYCFFRK